MRIEMNRNIPNPDLAKARQLFQDAGLTFPAIPDVLASQIKERGEWYFSSRHGKQTSPYLLDVYVRGVDQNDVEDYVVLSHSGHGVNSYAIQYYVVLGPLRMFLHLGWGGVYMDRDVATLEIRNCFSLADNIVPAALASPMLGSGKSLKIVGSTFYGSYWSAPGREPQHDESHFNTPAAVLSQALAWLTTK